MSKVARWACPDISSNKPMPCAEYFSHSDYHQAKDGLLNSAIYHCLGRSFNSDDIDSFRFDAYTNTEKEVISVYYNEIHKATLTILYGNPISLSLELI